VQPIDVIGPAEARAERFGRIVVLHPEELELDTAAFDDRVRVGAHLLERHIEPEGAVEVEHGLNRAARQYRNRLLGHAPKL
jgi:hypothetical protein